MHAHEPRRAGDEGRGHGSDGEGKRGDVHASLEHGRSSLLRRSIAPRAPRPAPPRGGSSPARSRRAAASAPRCARRPPALPCHRAAWRRWMAAPSPRRARRADACSRGRGSARAPRSPVPRSSPSCTRSRAARRSSLPAGWCCRRCPGPILGGPLRRARSPMPRGRPASPGGDGACPQRRELSAGTKSSNPSTSRSGTFTSMAMRRRSLRSHASTARAR